MIFTRKLLSVLCLVFLLLNLSVSKAQTLTTGTLDPTQVYTTGNVVQPTISGSGTTPWVNGVYQDSLTCWAWGDPGYCGPNAIVRPGDNINFSYGTTNLYQMQLIANLLPNMGTGLRVNGYNFGFTAKNGNGWDDGRVDYLTAYVSFYDPKGNLAYNKNYDLNYQFNWTTFNYSETFLTPFASKDLSSVQYGFVGRDNNYWAGPYGPEIYNVNFSLKYSVDPCFVDVLSSPSCPGYLDALAKLNPTPTISTEPTITTTSSGTIVNPTPTVTSSTQPAPAESTTTTTTTSSTTTNVTSGAPTATATTSVTPTANNPQPKVGEILQPGSAPKSLGLSTSQILGIVSSEQSRISTVEKTVVEQANQQAAMAASTATQQAEAVAASTQSQSIATSISIGMQSQQYAISSGNASVGMLFGSQPVATVTSIIPTMTQQLRQDSPLQNAYSILPDELTKNEVKNVSAQTPNKMILDQNQTQQIQEIKQPTQTSSVNQKAKDNELAGGVSLASITKQPTGFDMYLNAMPDAQFYAPKEIYRGQRNVDNARVLRGLTGGSDRLHQQMIDQQYNLGR